MGIVGTTESVLNKSTHRTETSTPNVHATTLVFIKSANNA